MSLVEKQSVTQTESVAGKPMTVYVAKMFQDPIPSFVGKFRKTPQWVVVRELCNTTKVVKVVPTRKAAIAYIAANY